MSWCLLPAAVFADVPVIDGLDLQPLAAQTRRVADALRAAGAPLPEAAERALAGAGDAAAIQRVLDPLVLAVVEINPESRVKAAAGPAKPELQEQGWRTFLVKVVNEAGVTAPLAVDSPNTAPVGSSPGNHPDPFGTFTGKGKPPEKRVNPVDVVHRFLDLATVDVPPMTPALSGLKVEYRILQIHCRDAGKREALLRFHVGQGTQELGFRSEVPILFEAVPSVEVTLGVFDEDGSPTTASFRIRDRQGRVYPLPSRRKAPDFFFHPQIYRADGETVRLPAGRYAVDWTRGPEYLPQRRDLEVKAGGPQREDFRLKRWIHPAKRGWWSGDHHIHAAGCRHYDTPSEGVRPEDMRRHQLGEDLNVACVLSWGPCWYFQKQFFEGKLNARSIPGYLMRYDVEVSGFPSSPSGHICLLKLKEDDYAPPGGKPVGRMEEWPSWDLPVLQWAKAQGAVVGFAHTGWGLGPVAAEKGSAPETLPNHFTPAMDGIGAQEFLVDAALGACDFLAAVDTPHIRELNLWYHALNCGFRTRISGETDFPCIYGDRIGMGRVYVKLDGSLDFDPWVEGLRRGRSYVTEGGSHLLDFSVNGVEAGVGDGETAIAAPGTVKVRATVAAHLPEAVSDEARGIRGKPQDEAPYWHIERARIGDGRKVPVEVVVNGMPVEGARREIVADGTLRELEWELPVTRSSWVAVRILPSSHTNPVWVIVGGKPVRAGRKSAEWCLRAVDRCWSQKEGSIRAGEKEAAARAYEEARGVYRRILAECETD